MIKRIAYILMMSCVLLSMSSCGKDDEPLQKDIISEAEITYTYTISEEMLEYFNITAEYLNAKGEKVGKHMTGPTLTMTTTATKFPAQRPISFIVTRTDKEAPTTTPAWSSSLSIIVSKKYKPSGNVENSSKNDAESYSPKPDKFAEWGERFIKKMATGYDVTIKSDGSISY